MESCGVVIVAGGSGKRMGAALPKQFALLDGEPILARTINRFAQAIPSLRIVVVLPEDRIEFWANLSARFKVAKHTVVGGGAERFHSVKRGLDALDDSLAVIGVHDAVRPFVSDELIVRAFSQAVEFKAVVPVVDAVDSFRMVDCYGSKIVDRSALRAVQTPQVFRASLLRKAYEVDFDPSFTDDASVVEHSGVMITLCEGERINIKITTSEDMFFASAVMQAGREMAEELMQK